MQKAWKRGEAPVLEDKPDWLKIGFHAVGTRNVMDIEVNSPFIANRPPSDTFVGVSNSDTSD